MLTRRVIRGLLRRLIGRVQPGDTAGWEDVRDAVLRGERVGRRVA
jgi:hypothetical protein